LQASLRYAFNQHNLTLAPPTNLGSGFHVKLVGNSSKSAHMDNGPEQEVVEIIVSQRHSNFWFSLDAAFATVAMIGQYELQHIAVGVFHDIAGELVPLFRADWDKLDALGKSGHAQPHWHFVQRPARIEGIVRTLEYSTTETVREFSLEPQAELFGRLVDYGMFHFAMTSLWEKEENPPYMKRVFDSDTFPKWFDKLAKYIAGQIGLLVKHTPIGDAPVVKEFAPNAT
jgi:hypothetical protein